jgi:hypothetical protein
VGSTFRPPFVHLRYSARRRRTGFARATRARRARRARLHDTQSTPKGPKLVGGFRLPPDVCPPSECARRLASPREVPHRAASRAQTPAGRWLGTRRPARTPTSEGRRDGDVVVAAVLAISPVTVGRRRESTSLYAAGHSTEGTRVRPQSRREVAGASWRGSAHIQ